MLSYYYQYVYYHVLCSSSSSTILYFCFRASLSSHSSRDLWRWWHFVQLSQAWKTTGGTIRPKILILQNTKRIFTFKNVIQCWMMKILRRRFSVYVCWVRWSWQSLWTMKREPLSLLSPQPSQPSTCPKGPLKFRVMAERGKALSFLPFPKLSESPL